MLAISKLTHRWSLPRPIIKFHIEKSGRGPGLEEFFPTMLGFPFNVRVTAEASNFKFIMQLEFAMAHRATIQDR